MRGIRTQVIDSIPYCYNNLPEFENPRQLFKYLKERTRFKHDKPNEETLQTAQTLFDNNVHGLSGAGDCDCFTITAVACCKVEKIPVRIVVVGNTPKNPTHVYCEVLDNGRWTAFDLCSPFYGDTKKYRYLSIIKVK